MQALFLDFKCSGCVDIEESEHTGDSQNVHQAAVTIVNELLNLLKNLKATQTGVHVLWTSATKGMGFLADQFASACLWKPHILASFTRFRVDFESRGLGCHDHVQGQEQADRGRRTRTGAIRKAH